MNYLAHLYLAEDSVPSVIGNMLGDFVKGPLDNRFGEEILKGINTHRKVDYFTDTHELFLSCKKLISSGRRRFAGIILDVSFDHFLAKNWNDYSTIELDIFNRRIYKLLKDNRNMLPQRVQYVTDRMVEEDWLGSYKQIEGVNKALNRIALRLKRENNLAGGAEELVSNYMELEGNFKVFFPQLISYVVHYQENYGKTASRA